MSVAINPAPHIARADATARVARRRTSSTGRSDGKPADPPAQSPDRYQSRSMVISQNGIVAAESPLAAQAGARILEAGGTAVDAAIAANAMMGLVAPMADGIGGDLFAIVHEAKTGKLYGLNASGYAPAGLSIDFLLSQGMQTIPRGIHAVTVPGVVDGWDKLLNRFGNKELSELLAPAIHVARAGFGVPELVGGLWDRESYILKSDDAGSRTFLRDGRPLRMGEIFKNPDLAASYEEIARDGRKAFYEGPVAKQILQASQHYGGTMTDKDLAEYSADWVTPISTTYNGWTVHEVPPNAQGIGALEMLNMMENFSLKEFGPGSTEALHAMIEAKKLAYADVARYIGDPKFSKLPLEGMLSKSYAQDRAKSIDMDRANCSVQPGNPIDPKQSGDTTYMCAVDRHGNMVSLIQSNFWWFGSGIVPPGAGFILQDRGRLFSMDKNSPNALEGRKRPVHTIIPGFMEKDDLRIAFGIMGGWNQAQAHAQFVSNMADHGMNIQAALEAPRFSKWTFPGCDVMIEDGIPQAVRDELTVKGHQIEVRGRFSEMMGGGQAVARNLTTGVNYGASDPRKDGEAVPELRLGDVAEK